MQKIFCASEIFTGQEWIRDHAVVTENGRIEKIIPVEKGLKITENFQGFMMAPALIDVQVYGAAGKLFAVYPEAATLRLMEEEFKKNGTALFLPTVATNTIDVFKKCIDAIKEYHIQGGRAIPGIHLEGPWINQEKKGAHKSEWIHAPTKQEARDLLEYGKGAIKMITLAPEVCSAEVLELISSYPVLISAGHSSVPCHQAMEAFEKGVTTVTHLYNAMSPLHHREPGLVGAALLHKKVMSGIIPDGRHVDFAAVRIAKDLMGPRLFAITDAVTETTSGPYQHYLAGDKYECNGILSGSALSMHKALLNLIHHVGLDRSEALRMCSLYPARALMMDDRHGKIAPGYAAQFLVIDAQYKIVKTII
ncbi:MAG: N-acetylglucosamine-6-phosphate deacetylase [Flavisolibacter sp.]